MAHFDIKPYREAKEISQERLAELVGVTRTQINNIEKSKSLPSIKTAQAIAKELDFNWTKFFEE